MAKSQPTRLARPEPYPETTHIDVPMSVLKGMEIGEKVTITIKGEIIELRKPADPKSEYDKPCIRVKVSSKKVDNTNAFAAMADDDDEDED